MPDIFGGSWEAVGDSVIIHVDEGRDIAVSREELQSMSLAVNREMAKDILFMAPHYLKSKAHIFIKIAVVVVAGLVLRHLLL